MTEKEIQEAAELFKMFADPTRVKIMLCLFDGEYNVGDIVSHVGVSQTAISHQLRALKQKHLVKCRREGKNMIYSIADEHVKTIINTAAEHIRE